MTLTCKKSIFFHFWQLWALKSETNISLSLMAHNWQKWKSISLHTIYRVEAINLAIFIYTWKIAIFVNMWNLGQFREK